MSKYVLGAMACAVALAAAACGPPEPQGPNVLLISVDTLRVDRLTCYGGPEGTTPHIDGLARQGVRFASVQAPRGLTWPSLTTLMTGLHPRTHQIRGNGAHLDEQFVTLPQRLTAAGYETGAFLSNMCDAPNRGLAV
ncbi:MAG: sulfatase-like hydrolase/transferase, partial [Acidobacteria bacterium]|nr:sulfatase-like hydrolase/transferase [Acidobacteriota bacterium]